METLLNFLLKASAGLALFYLVYWIFVRNETFHQANRVFLMLALLTSVMLPLLPIHYKVLVEPQIGNAVFHDLNETIRNVQSSAIISRVETSEFFTWQKIVRLIYFTGIAFFLFRLCSQTFNLVYILLKSKISSTQGIRIVENDRYELPFSFFYVVFINPKFHKQEDLPEILAHEKVHIRENHWFDLLFIELLTVIFWFNPFIWFFERSIKQNHEYLADQGVLSLGQKVGRYQALLVNQLMGMQVIGITNNLNFSLNTNRLKMMTKKKSPKIRALRFLFALPSIALVLLACAERSYEVKQDQVEDAVGFDKISQNQHVIHGKVINDESQQPLHGATVVIRGTTIGTVVDSEGNFTLTDPSPKVDENTGLPVTEIVISFVGFESEVKYVNTEGKNTDESDFTVNMKRTLIAIDMNVTEESVPPPPPPPVTKSTAANSKNRTENVFFVVEEMPKYPGGHSELVKYVTKMQEKYAREKNLEGYVRVAFTVDEQGKVTNIRFLPIFEIIPTEEERKDLNFVKATGYGNEKEQKAATEIVLNMKDWKPGAQRNKPVPVDFVIPIVFSN